MPDDHGGEPALIRVAQPCAQLRQLVRVHPRDRTDRIRVVELAPAAAGFRWRKIVIATPKPACDDRRSQFFQFRVDNRIVSRTLEAERITLIDLVGHEPPRGAVGDTQFRRAGGGIIQLVILVADDRFSEFLESRDAVGNIGERSVVEVDEQEVGGLGHVVGIASVTQAGGGDEQARRRLLRQADQLDLADVGAEQGMVETAMTELVGDLEHDVAKATLPDPARRVRYRGAHGVFVFQDLVLPLVEAAEDDH